MAVLFVRNIYFNWYCIFGVLMHIVNKLKIINLSIDNWKGMGYNMSREIDMIFLRKALEFLQLASDQYNVLPHTTIMRVQNVIEELEDILREGY